MSELFADVHLMRLEGGKLVPAGKGEILAGKKVALYFSAHWCPPCRMFTPTLKDFYEEILADGKPFEIIFVTSDRSEGDQVGYMAEAHGDWLTLKHGDPFIATLKAKYEVRSIPTLIVIKPDGTIVTAAARDEVRKGPRAYDSW
eukprot:comp9161_c0_seq1/m.4321 comp9161_c0_seq1/g.4321  ORF comp9161_c0_seq1/g.4321 comp9161_c0_seq1/m.4321 type:complete len:144 (-) comp9161_c0_seq1:537-968(-)